jgi:hypothetical protein
MREALVSTLQQHEKEAVINSPIMKTFGKELQELQKFSKFESEASKDDRENSDGVISPLIPFFERGVGSDDGHDGNRRRVRIDLPFHLFFILSVSLSYPSI